MFVYNIELSIYRKLHSVLQYFPYSVTLVMKQHFLIKNKSMDNSMKMLSKIINNKISQKISKESIKKSIKDLFEICEKIYVFENYLSKILSKQFQKPFKISSEKLSLNIFQKIYQNTFQKNLSKNFPKTLSKYFPKILSKYFPKISQNIFQIF